MSATPTLSVELTTFCGEHFVTVRIAGVESPNAPTFPLDHIIIIEPVSISDTVDQIDGFHCRSNVDCAFGDTIELALEAHIDRAKSANRGRSGYQAVVLDTIVPLLEAEHDYIVNKAGALLDLAAHSDSKYLS